MNIEVGCEDTLSLDGEELVVVCDRLVVAVGNREPPNAGLLTEVMSLFLSVGVGTGLAGDVGADFMALKLGFDDVLGVGVGLEVDVVLLLDCAGLELVVADLIDVDGATGRVVDFAAGVIADLEALGFDCVDVSGLSACLNDGLVVSA